MANHPLFLEAIQWFKTLYKQVDESRVQYPTSVSLATANQEGRPLVRTVLIKDVNLNGFSFYTNTQSRKGQHLIANPHGALCFFWEVLSKQVLVEGPVQQVPDSEADAYWVTRPRESQIGAWASLQSQLLPNRETLLSRVADFEKKYANKDVPRPSHWTGFRLVPQRIEFWEEAKFRLHNRTVYQKVKDEWTKGLIYP